MSALRIALANMPYTKCYGLNAQLWAAPLFEIYVDRFWSAEFRGVRVAADSFRELE